MSAQTTTPVAEHRSTVPSARASLPNVMRSEWTKLWSVRSTWWSLIALVVVTIGLSTLISWGTSTSESDIRASDFDPTSISLTGIAFGQLVIAVLGAMTITSEYTTGGLRTTLTAVPQRMRVLQAKLAVFLAVALVAGLIVSFGSFLAGQLFFAPKDVEASLGDPGVLRAVFGGGLYLAASGLFAFALGVLLRQTAAAITVAIAGLLVLPPLTGLLPGSVGDTVNKLFTTNAGAQIMNVVRDHDQLGPWPGFLVFVAWGVVLLAVGAAAMQRRDA
jgi:ABC-type transport system involved in multi-copper enzyme maturation permease subunit